ncbi:MAG: hypothetical protein AAF805_11315 [Planctomycetota bacterium]
MLLNWILVATSAALAADAKIDAADGWNADYGAALAETKADERPLLVVLDNPAEAAESLGEERLEAGGLERYALCRVDVTSEYGREVAKAFGVTEFPHVAIIDRTGSVIVRRIAGDVSAEQWESILDRHAAGLREGRTRYTVAKPIVSEPPAAAATPVTSSGYLPSEVAFPTARPIYSAPSSYCPSCQLR